VPGHSAKSLAVELQDQHSSGSVCADERLAWLIQKPSWSPSNNSFKPKLLRSGNNMAGKACHVVASTTHFGLTQALDGMWKSMSELTQEDLATTPVWEWKEESGLELVRPSTLTGLSEYRDGPVHIAATRYITARGVEYFGHCSPADSSRLDYVQPVIFTPKGPLPLWYLGGLSQAQRATLYSALSGTPSTLFPLRLECLVPVDGVLYTDSIDAV